MALANKFLILLLLLQSKVFSQENLPVLFAKLPSNYVRLISKDGVFTYYITRSGSLMLSTNYQSVEVKKDTPGTNYLLYSSPARKMILVTKDENYFDFMSQREANTIYKLEFGKKEMIKIGYGLSPKLHLDDSWGTYFNVQENSLYFQNLNSEPLKFKLKINNPINPFFIPQVVMLDKETSIYTDLNKDGFPAVSIFKRGEKKSELLFLGNSPFEKIDICLKDETLVVGYFGYGESKKGSTIDLIPIKNINFSNKTTIYQSKKNDIGNIICDFDKEKIYFIKNFSTNLNQVYEVVSLNLKTKEEKKLTDILNATQITTMDDKLLLIAMGKTYVLEGKSDYQKDGFQKEEKKKAKK